MPTLARVPLAAALLLLAIAAFGCGSRSAPAEKTAGESVTVEVNSRAPAFAAQTLDGATVRLADFIGERVVLMEFWSVACKSCLEEMPHIEALHAKYGDEGLAVLSINTDVFSTKRVASFLKARGVRPPYPIIRDARQEIVSAFKVELLPVTVIVDRSGWIRLYQEGYRPGDERRFERVVRKLLGREGSEDVTLAARKGVTVFAPAGASLPDRGKRFPALAGHTLDGGPVPLTGNGTKLLFFWSLFCKPCRDEFPDVERLGAEHAAKGVEVLSVNVDASTLRPRVERFAAQYPGLRCLADPPGPGSLAETLGVRVTPSHVLLDAEGRVVHAASGSSDLSNVEAYLIGGSR